MSSRMRLIGSLFVLAIAALALALPGIAAAKDRNHDRIPDKWEKKHNLSLKHKQTKRDQDRDGLKNRAEFRSQTDPHDSDSDDDGVEDGDEGAGTIASFNPDDRQADDQHIRQRRVDHRHRHRQHRDQVRQRRRPR